MKKKIFFALMVVVALMILGVAYHRAAASGADKNHHTRLLFPFVVNENGFDTAIVISNTSMDPFGTHQESGACTLYFYGVPSAETPYTTPTVSAGSQFSSIISILKPGFGGYVIADCDFRNAHGWAMISDVGARNLAAGQQAIVLKYPRPANEGLDE